MPSNCLALTAANGSAARKDRRGRDARRYGHDVVLPLRSGDDFIGL